METDHTEASEELKSIVSQNNLQLPTQLERKHRSTVDKLSQLTGAEFDRKYMDAMVSDHEKDIAHLCQGRRLRHARNLSGSDGSTATVNWTLRGALNGYSVLEVSSEVNGDTETSCEVDSYLLDPSGVPATVTLRATTMGTTGGHLIRRPGR